MGVSCDTGNMQILLLLAAIGYTSAAVTCEDCKAASAGLVDHLTSAESLQEQELILIQTLCPATPDPKACEEGITQWWKDIAGCLYPHFIGDDACIKLGLCTKNTLVSQLKDWTCEECTAIMGKVSAFMVEEATVAEAVSWLQGECFCGKPGHSPDCGDLVSQLLPGAMKILAAVLGKTTVHLCQEVVGVC